MRKLFPIVAILVPLVATTALTFSACGRFGREVASTEVVSNQPLFLVFTPTTDKPHQLWLDHDPSTGGAADLRGSLTFVGPAGSHSVSVDLAAGDSSPDGRQRASRPTRRHLVTVPAAPPGSTVTVTGLLAAEDGTRVGRLVVTR